jgi:hypothetical protein
MLGNMADSVKSAVRAKVQPGQRLTTPTGRGQFTVAEFSPTGLVLLLGATQSRTPVPWKALEEIPDLLRGRGWVTIGTSYSTASSVGTLDAHLKGYLKTATAGWVAVLLERAGVLAIDRSPPARVKLEPKW